MKKIGLDATDIRILSAVQSHGQISKAKLAEIVNISPTPCWVRLDRLKAAGYIKGFRAEIALDRVADFTQVMVTVSLSSHRKADFERFEAFVRTQDQIIECIETGGGMDYFLKVISPNLSAFRELMESMNEDEVGVEKYFTYFATRTVKSSPPNLQNLVKKTAN